VAIRVPMPQEIADSNQQDGNDRNRHHEEREIPGHAPFFIKGYI
jgi:hypothetical protein